MSGKQRGKYQAAIILYKYKIYNQEIHKSVSIVDQLNNI